jgi:DmsE family decaheme c-type cytochrome
MTAGAGLVVYRLAIGSRGLPCDGQRYRASKNENCSLHLNSLSRLVNRFKHLPSTTFRRGVTLYLGEHTGESFSCLDRSPLESDDICVFSFVAALHQRALIQIKDGSICAQWFHGWKRIALGIIGNAWLTVTPHRLRENNMKRLINALAVLTVLGALGGGSATWAATDLVLRGDAACTKCHEESGSPKVLQIGKTKHGTVADSRTPTCTSCHGASEAHQKGPSGGQAQAEPDVVFETGHGPAEAKSAQCLACHKSDSNRSHWAGSTHESRDVTCANCHTVHAAKDKVLAKATQFEVCFACHKDKRAEVNRPSHHPVLEGKVACSDCHNPHGSAGPKLMKRDSVVDTCYQCHAEKRGPFVHNHEPVSEDCGNCHNPHGTVVESMLKVRPPFLCHQCHTPHGGFIPQVIGAQVPGLAPTTPNGLGKGTTNVTQGRACMNCHTQVHGSNNPSATNPTPQFMLR